MATLYRCNACGFQTKVMKDLARHMIEHCRQARRDENEEGNDGN